MQDILTIAAVVFVGLMVLMVMAAHARNKTEAARHALHDDAARALTGGINNCTTVNVGGQGGTEWPDSPQRSRPAEPDTNILAAIPSYVKACAVGALNGTLPDSEGFYEWFKATEGNFMPGVLKKCPTNRLDVRAALIRFAEANVGLHMDAVLAQETKRA